MNTGFLDAVNYTAARGRFFESAAFCGAFQVCGLLASQRQVTLVFGRLAIHRRNFSLNCDFGRAWKWVAELAAALGLFVLESCVYVKTEPQRAMSAEFAST